jgi:hypothetical protein
MATDFKYAAQTDLEMYYPNFSSYDAKRQILGWETTGVTHFYKSYNTGLITKLFFDGIEGTAVTDDPDANYEFRYSSGNDSVEVYIDTANPIDLLMEGGIDNATYFDQMLVNASMELNNLLDGRYATPLPKVAQIDQNTASSSQSKEYDAIVIKMTCYICVSNILRAEGQTEEADYYYSQVTNSERTGMVDRLNAGEFKLSYEVDAKDRQGAVNNKNVSGSMDIVETAGEYYGEKYDLLKIEATVTGVYGVGKVKVHYYGSDKIWGQESSEEFVTGGLQSLSGLGGLLVRFQGASITDGDTWEIEVNSADRKITNAQSSAIELNRTGYTY